MRYQSGYKAEKRMQLLEISGQIAKKNGFAATGIDSFMKAAGVTSGAFYSHFSSKQDLFKALVEHELNGSIEKWQNNPHEQAEQWIEFELNRYLTLSHVNHADYGCVVPALANEISRTDNDIKQLYQKELQRGHALFANRLGSDEKAWAVLCQLVGAILVARSIADEAIQLVILESSKKSIQSMLQITV
jgi:TetR/AcrR family transcriptional regulator, transcriptional repressor for nem operon